jgi:hypothetical protein
MPGGRYGWGGSRRSQLWQANTATVTRQPRPPVLPGTSQGSYPSRQLARPSQFLVPPDAGASGTTYIKIGSATAARVATGADAVTFAETGRAVSARTGGASRQASVNRAGTARSALVGSGVRASVLTKTGATGGYPIPSPGLLPSETLLPGMFGLFRVASGARQAAGSTYLKAGKAISARVGSGSKSVTYTEANAYTAALPSPNLFPSAGASPSTGLLPSPSLRPGEGALLPAAPRRRASWSATAADSVVRTRSGIAVSARIAAGTPAVVFREAGTGIVGLEGSGVRDVEAAGEQGRQLGNMTVTVAQILRAAGQAHVRSQGDLIAIGPYIIELAGPAHARAQGVPALSGRALPAGLLHGRDLGQAQVDAVTLELLALDRAH